MGLQPQGSGFSAFRASEVCVGICRDTEGRAPINKKPLR